MTTTLLLSKALGFGLITWGRNIGDWPEDVPLSEVSTGYRVGILGRALLYSLFVLDDFRYVLKLRQEASISHFDSSVAMVC